MSTLALGLAGAVAPAEKQQAKPSLMQRLIEAREDKARREVLAFLTGMDDGSLRRFGFDEEGIAALRRGEMRLPK